MGNTPSQEVPRPAGRKLSKPRVAGRDPPRGRVPSSAPASQTAIHHIKAAQFSNSYLVGTVPVPVSQRTSVDAVSPGPATAVFHDNPLADPAKNGHEPVVEPKSPTLLGSTDLLRAERIDRRQSTGHGPLGDSAPPSRTASRQGRHSMQPVTRTQSIKSTRTHISSKDAPPVPLEEMPRSQSLVERRKSLHSRSNSRNGESLDPVCNLRRNSSTPQPEAMPPSRTQSETSLYPPHRRRSLIMTPGVATRADPPKTLRRKQSFRRSMEPTPSVTRTNSIDSKSSKHMSLPVLPSRSDLTDRVPTPSEAEYKQLGGMKFGSLHITNGAPATTPAQEPEEGVLYAPQATSRDGRETLDTVAFVQTRDSGMQIKNKSSHRTFHLGPASPCSPKTISSQMELADHSRGLVSSTSEASPQQVSGTYPAPVTVRPPTPELETTSKHAAVDDQLFEEEDGSPRPGTAEPVVQVVAVAKQMDAGLKSPIRPSLVQVTRKDSGYVSNASKSSRKTLSTIDSGYSSTVSVPSARQKRLTTDGSDYLTSADQSSESNGSTPGEFSSNDTSPLRNEEIPSPPEEHLQPSISSKDDASLSTPRTSTSSATHSIIRLPSLGSRKSRDQRQLRKSASQDRPNSPASFLQRVASPTQNSQGGSYNGPRMSGLRRLLSGGSRKGLATSYAVHEFDSAVPSVPRAVEEQLQGHSANFPTAPKRLALRVEASRDSLGTIMSVDDASEPGTMDKLPVPPIPQPTTESLQQHQFTESTNHRRRRSKGLSISSMSGSITGAASSLLSPKATGGRNVIRRRSTMDEKRVHRGSRDFQADSDSDDEVIVDGSLVDDRNFMMPNVRRSIGNSAFDQAMMGMGDQGRYPTPEKHAWMKEPYADPRASRRQPQLRSRKSAPDVRQTMAGHLSPVFERESSMASKTPPPISMQTRGSKKKRSAPKASRRQSSPAGVPQYRQSAPYDPYESASSAASSTEDLGRHPYPSAATAASASMPGTYPRAAPLPSLGPHAQQWSAPAPKMRRPLFGQRYSYDGHGYRPPSLPQQHQSDLAPMPSREQNKDAWMPNRQRRESEQSQEELGPHENGQLNNRPSSSRVSGEAQQQSPFRVLHSYNSPAYKGIPIWG